VWVRWDSRLVRVFNHRLEQIAVHVKRDKGRFSTQDRHIAAEKISSVERGAEWLMKRAWLIGPETGKWARAVIDVRGVQGVRVLAGLRALAERYDVQAIENACRSARSHGVYRLRALRELIRSETVQETFAFAEEHPLIRSLSEYQSLTEVSFQPEDQSAAAGKGRNNRSHINAD